MRTKLKRTDLFIKVSETIRPVPLRPVSGRTVRLGAHLSLRPFEDLLLCG